MCSSKEEAQERCSQGVRLSIQDIKSWFSTEINEESQVMYQCTECAEYRSPFPVKLRRHLERKNLNTFSTSSETSYESYSCLFEFWKDGKFHLSFPFGSCVMWMPLKSTQLSFTNNVCLTEFGTDNFVFTNCRNSLFHEAFWMFHMQFKVLWEMGNSQAHAFSS